MRRIVGFAVLVLLLAASASGAGARHKVAPKCLPAHAHVLFADSQAAIYSIPATREEGLIGTVQTWGCAYGRKSSYKIWEEDVQESTESNGGIHDLTLNGTMIGYEVSRYEGTRYTEGEETVSEWHVIVRDLRTGRVLHKVPTGMPEPARPKLLGRGEAEGIVVKSDGAVAWINNTVQRENRYEIHALDKTGERVLAVGSDIDPHSLALAGSTLYWTQGGKPMSATLN
jgi:hypothetical protein